MRKNKNSEEWIKRLDDLQNYVASHPEIVVTKSRLSIPKNYRSEFFDKVLQIQIRLSEKILGKKIEEGLEVAKHCLHIRNQLLEMTGLKEFRLASQIESLLERPKETIAKPIFELTLDVIQQRITTKEMEVQAGRMIDSFYRDLIRATYEAWAYYGIVAALEPVKFYDVYSLDTVKIQAVETDTIIIGSQIISPERRLPEAIFETKDGQIYAMKSEVARELDFYNQKMEKRRDSSSGGNTVDVIAHRVLLLYKLESINDIPLIANRDKLSILPNDLMCEFLLPEEIEQPSFFSLFYERINTMRSRQPMQILTFDEQGRIPAEFLKKDIAPSFEKKPIGLNERKLQDIANLLKAQK